MAKNKQKHNKLTPPPSAATHSPAQSQIEAQLAKIAANLDATKLDAPALAAPSITKETIAAIDAGGPDRRAEIELLLLELAELSKSLKEVDESFHRRSDDLTRKEDAFNKRSDENKRLGDDLVKSKKDLDEQKVEIKKAEVRNLEKERDLETRELDARNGFAAQNAAALNDLLMEVSRLEKKRNELHTEIHKAEQKALNLEAETVAKLDAREAEIANKERLLQIRERRLDAEQDDLERSIQQAREDATREAAKEMSHLRETNERAELRLQKVYRDWKATEAKIEEFRDLVTVLGGRSPRELMEELATQKTRIQEVENRLAHNEDDQPRSENAALRKIRDEQKAQLDEIHSELAVATGQLHRLRLGVSDKQNLEKEKRALEKNNQILSARLNDLGKTVDDLTQAQQAEKPFPQLSGMDDADKSAETPGLVEVPDLKKFTIELQHRIAQAEDDVSLFFRLEDIQLLLAGLAMSQLHIFQGISGTGKTSLAKAFAKAVGGHCTDIAVQAGWRDRDDLLGHYNAFEKRFYEKECLQGLYRSQMTDYKDRCNIILLDEMNLSRPEQYFAEFLSALEKNDPRDRLISLSETRLPNAPEKLVEGRKIRVPGNVWFVGTANHDETTNEFADKTYDRAHVMTLPRHESSFTFDKKSRSTFSYQSLIKRFDMAIAAHASEVDELLIELTTGALTDVLQQHFDLGWGNRFERQALRFIPVFMATGGKREDALDHLLASRIFRRGKVTGRYDATIEDLNAVENALKDLWKLWKASPKKCLSLISDDRRRKENGA
jgi:hypothetical protein